MRPPQNAGESPRRRHRFAAAARASMRPPQNAGESCDICRKRVACVIASMRPPQNAGESTFAAKHPGYHAAWLQ